MMRARGLRTFGVVGIGVLASAMFVGAASADIVPPITGVGTVACQTAGRVTFDPPLAVGGTATTETVTLKANLVHCTGTGDGATVKSGKATASVTLGTNDCTQLATITSGSLSTNVVWHTVRHAPKLVDSTVDLTSGTVGLSPAGKATLSLAGSATAGSFSGNAAAVDTSVAQAVKSIANRCVHGNLKGLTFRASASSASLG
jgi:hypothetical protein